MKKMIVKRKCRVKKWPKDDVEMKLDDLKNGKQSPKSNQGNEGIFKNMTIINDKETRPQRI